MKHRATRQQRFRERTAASGGVNTLTDNSDEMLPAKIDLRRWLISQITGKIKVADLFAGNGVIWKDLRAEPRIAYHLSADIDPTKKAAKLRADAGAIAAAVADYDILDLDSHTSPYKALADNKPKKRQGIAFTIGIVAPKKGSIENAFRSIIPPDKMPNADLARALYFCMPPAEFAEFTVRAIAQRIGAKTARYTYKMHGAMVIYAATIR